MNKKRKYILHWLDGKKEPVEGTSIADAFMKAGYGNGAMTALDYYEEVNEQNGVCVITDPTLKDMEVRVPHDKYDEYIKHIDSLIMVRFPMINNHALPLNQFKLIKYDNPNPEISTWYVSSYVARTLGLEVDDFGDVIYLCNAISK